MKRLPKILFLVSLVMLVACDDSSNAENNAGTNPYINQVSDCRKFLTPIPQSEKSHIVDGNARARLGLDIAFQGHKKENDQFLFSHDRTFREYGGLGANIYRGKICVDNAKNCLDSCLDYRIEQGGILTQNGHLFITKSLNDKVSMKYWVVDDNNNLSTVEIDINIVDGNPKQK